MFGRDFMTYVDDNRQNDFAENNENDNFADYDMNPGCVQNPITEATRERCVHRTFVHEVPHVCPIHTRIINHHVYRHTYRPEYTCSEENVVSNVQEGSCCQYR